MLYNIYLDESYTDNGKPPVFVVGGYIVRAVDAVNFEAKWKAVLAEFDVPYFHMVEVVSCKGIFKKLTMDGCDQLIRRLIPLIHEHYFYAVTTIINSKRPWSFSSPDLYTTAVENTIRMLSGMIPYEEAGSQIAVFIETQTSAKVADKVLKRLDFGKPLTHKFVEKATSGIVQAADMLVWLTLQFVKGKLKGKSPRLDYKALIDERFSSAYVYMYHGRRTLCPTLAIWMDDPFANKIFQEAFGDTPWLTISYASGLRTWRKGFHGNPITAPWTFKRGRDYDCPG